MDPGQPGAPAPAGAHEAEFEALEALLRRRHARFEVYLRVRGYVGLALIALGLAFAAAALLVVSTALGWVDVPRLAPWVGGFNVVLATAMPAAMAFLLVRAGLAYWRARHPDDPDTGCVTC